MIEKFKKASNDRLIRWIDVAVVILNQRGYQIKFSVNAKSN